ncbi:MAG: HlyD family efflux transporter periplasmic adaptor subunit [Clostridiales bacterium]|jgi:HlyD family secretion protein|nr:HlyD family efflux transporter periplasmic adaptor subunit [Clostridiales bacterium]
MTLAAAVCLSGCGGAAQASSSGPAVKKAAIGDLIVGLTADGTVALPVTNLNFEVEGIVSKIYAAAGGDVKKGDLLAELDDADYQLDIETALNSLAKASSNYDDAVWQYEYGLKNDKMNLDSTRASLDAGFDESGYLTAVADAETTLADRETELAEAEAAAEDPYDSYSSDRQLEDAKATLAQRQEELDEAKASAGEETFDEYSYALAVSDASAMVAKRRAELTEAESTAKSPYDSYSSDRQLEDAKAALAQRQAELDEAEEAAKDPFDESSYDRQIADAEANVTSKRNAYAGADASQLESASAAVVAAETSLIRIYEDMAKARLKAEEDAAAKVDAARKNVDAAQQALDRLNQDIARAKSNAASDASDKLATAKQNLQDAQTSLEKAQRNYDDARSAFAESGSKSVETARKNFENASQSLTRLQEDIARAVQNAEKDADSKLKTAMRNLTDAERALTKARENYEKARKDYAASSAKSESSYALQLESYEKAQGGSNAVSNAAAAIKDAELALQEARNKLEKTRVYAPIDGRIINIGKKEGERVTAAAAGMGGQMIFGTSSSGSSFLTICDLSAIYLSANITEGDIIGVETGQEVRVTIDSISDTTYTGSVQTVSSLPTTDSSGITTYAVTVKLDGADPLIKDGMAALLTFIRLERPNALLIPNKAVFIEDDRQYVNVLKDDGTYEQREVVCGLTNGTETEALSGLSEGESVAAGAVK